MATTFAERWAAKQRTLAENHVATPMVACGTTLLPRDAAPFLSFSEAESPQSVWDLFELSPRRFGKDQERLSRLLVIGSDGAGNPICIQQQSGAVVLVDHENLFASAQFVNSTVQQLAECLLAYLGEHDPERFRSAVLDIDHAAMAENAFWCNEAKCLSEENETAMDDSSTHNDQAADRQIGNSSNAARPAPLASGIAGRFTLAIRRFLGRGH